MERKVPPPRGLGAPPVANGAQQPYTRRNGPPNAFAAPPAAANADQNTPPPPPHQLHAPQSFGFPAVNTNAGAARRGWKPGRVGGRHDSPLYGKNRKRPSSTSMDSNVSWSGSEIESVGGFSAAHSEQEQVSRLSWASSVAAKEEAPSAQELAPAASLFGAQQQQSQSQQPPPAGESVKQRTGSEGGMGVQPPKTPLGKPTQDSDGGISAAQRVRMELSAHADSRAGSRANSSENVFATPIPPVYDEEKSGPQSCPSTFNNTRQPQFSIDKLRQLRSNELVASKLLPTRTSVNSLMGYVRELQLSEATLRKQLVKTKQHTEEELSQSLSKVSELERTMQEVERDRENARRKLEEQEQLIRDLAAKLKQAEAAKTKSSTSPVVDELPPIAEETSSQTDTVPKTLTMEENTPDTARKTPPSPAPPVEPPQPPVQQKQSLMPPVHPGQEKDNSRAEQFGLTSPRSPNRPLWDPWASGGATPMKNLPPVFTIGSTGLDPLVAASMSAVQTSTTDSTTTATGEYELKSVLMSPRRVEGQTEASENGNPVQQVPQNESTQQEFAPQYPAPAFNVGALPSPSYPFEAQNESYGVQDQQEASLIESPSQAVPMLPAGTKTPTDDSSFEQQEAHNAPPVQTSTESFVPPEGDSVETNEDMVPPPTLAEHATVPSPVQTLAENDQFQHDVSEVATPYGESTEVAQPEQVANAEAENAASSLPSAPPQGSSPPLPPPTSEVHPPRPASPDQKEQERKGAPAEPVSLETLLVDFFTEVDKKRLKMAKVYGKRYAGREKWLFAELTKRYGAAKVSALKARYETGSSGDASTTTSNGNGGKSDHHPAQSSNTSDHPKAGRQGHPRHPQFFHPPTPASNVDLSAGMPPVPPSVTQPVENDASSSQSRQEAEGGTPPIPSGKVSSGHTDRVSPRQRHKTDNISAFSGFPPSIPTAQETGEGNNATTVGTNGPPMMNGPPRPTQREQRTGQFNPPPPPPPGRMDSNNAAPLGLRQRHNAAGSTAQGQKNIGAELPAVTLEGLLKELYKTHQPDKLKNVSIVAKQYAGKERELVGLLKGKYGALSVKRLEENLEVLERAHSARMGGKNTGKKRGCFVRTISLMFWLSVLLYFSFGAVFVSFVVLDAWECHAVDSDEQELEIEECVPLKKELEAFTYERIADYMSQSHPDACFCLEWKACESALFTNLSGDDLVSLVRLVPFSPDSFGAPWIASVKEQVPSQEFYDSYAKPVVDLSFDVGAFVWSSGLELAGYGEGSDDTLHVVENAAENDAADIPSFDKESKSDEHTASLEELRDEVENESFVNEVESANQLSEEVEAEVDAEAEAAKDFVLSEQIPVVEEAEAAKDFVLSEQIPVMEEATTFDAELHTDEGGVAKEEEAIVENIVNVEEDATIIDGESSSFGAADEEYSMVESTGPVESEYVPVKEPELVDAAEEEPVGLGETEVTETLTEDDTVIAKIEEAESIDRNDDGASASTEADVVDAMVDGVEEVSNVEVEGSEGASTDENVVESDDIVEVEVRQEGLDLSYPETEDDQHVESVEVSADGLEEESESVLGGVEDVSSEAIEAEIEVNADSEDVVADGPKVESELVANAFDEDLAAPSDADVEVMESESDVEAVREVSEVEVESVDGESSSSEDLEVEGSPELSAESESVVDDPGVESSIPADVEVSVQGSEDDSSVPNEAVEVEAGENEDSIATEVESEVETPSDDMEVVASEEGHADVLVEEELIVAETEIELASNSSDVDGTDLVSEESTISSSDEDAVVIENEVGGSDEATVPAEVEAENAEAVASNDVDESVIPAEVEASLAEDAEMVASNDVDESDIPADIEAAIPEADMEEGFASVSSEEVVEHELPGDLENEFSELKEEVDEVLTIPTEVESVGEEEVVAEVESSFPSETEVESVDGFVDEETAVDNDDVDSTTLSETEAEQSASEVDVVSELVEESVAIEGTETSVDTDTGAAEVAEEASVDDAKIIGGSAINGNEDAVVADEAETTVTTDVETSTVDEEASVSGEEVAMDEDGVEETSTSEILVLDGAVDAADGVDTTEEASSTDEPTIIDTETTEPQQVPADASDEDENGGIVSAVNEVLARLVEPFEAAKTAMPEVEAEGKHEVEEL